MCTSQAVNRYNNKLINNIYAINLQAMAQDNFLQQGAPINSINGIAITNSESGMYNVI